MGSHGQTRGDPPNHGQSPGVRGAVPTLTVGLDRDKERPQQGVEIAPGVLPNVVWVERPVGQRGRGVRQGPVRGRAEEEPARFERSFDFYEKRAGVLDVLDRLERDEQIVRPVRNGEMPDVGDLEPKPVIAVRLSRLADGVVRDIESTDRRGAAPEEDPGAIPRPARGIEDGFSSRERGRPLVPCEVL